MLTAPWSHASRLAVAALVALTHDRVHARCFRRSPGTVPTSAAQRAYSPQARSTSAFADVAAVGFLAMKHFRRFEVVQGAQAPFEGWSLLRPSPS